LLLYCKHVCITSAHAHINNKHKLTYYSVPTRSQAVARIVDRILPHSRLCTVVISNCC